MCQSTPGAPTQRDLPQRLEPQIMAQPLGELANPHLYANNPNHQIIQRLLGLSKIGNFLSAHPKNLLNNK